MTHRPAILTLAVAGGGTGGHTYPAMTTVNAVRDLLAERGSSLDVTWIGTAAGLEARVAAEHAIAFHPITTGKLRRTRSLESLRRNLADVLRVPLGVAQAFAALARLKPDVVLTSGGYVALPVGIAAWLLRRLLVIHEQVTTLGLTNRVLARLATQVAVSYAATLDHLPGRIRSRTTVTGNPVRPQVLTGDPAAGRAAFHLRADLPVLYVTGGAQGSVQINNLVAAILPDLLGRALQVVHQCGSDSLKELRQVRAALPAELADRYAVTPFIGADLPHVLAAADLVISRAGAGTIAELRALGKPSILIPLVPTGGDEQRRNARYLADRGAAVTLGATTPTPEGLLAAVTLLLDDPDARRRMAKAAAELGRLAAASSSPVSWPRRCPPRSEEPRRAAARP